MKHRAPRGRGHISLIAATLLLIVGGKQALAQGGGSAPKMCPGFDAGQGVTAADRTAPAEKGIFTELDAKEIAAVHDYLSAQAELQLKPVSQAGAGDNYIFTLELLPPPKAAALAFLDAGGPRPPRKALAVIFLMNNTKWASQVLQVEVGDLPKPSYWKEYRLGKQAPGPIPVNTRPVSTPEYAVVEKLVQDAMLTLTNVTKAVLGGYSYAIEGANDCGDKCLTWSDSAPRGVFNTQRKYWIFFMRVTEGLYLQMPGLEMYLDMSGTDPSKWKIDYIYFARKLWRTAADLAAAFKADPGSDITATIRPPLPNGTTAYRFKGATFYAPGPQDISYSSNQVRDPAKGRPANKRRGPVEYEPNGKRYNISGSRVSYMGWELDVGISTSSSMRFHDVRFKGERIAYELAVQSAYAAYGGPTPQQGQTMYLDNAWGMGASHYELVHGIDCPAHASYMDFYHLWGSETVSYARNSVCIFEQNFNLPQRRHFDKDYAGSYRFYAGVPNHGLVIRAISTVYNYDYVYDLVLHTDGSLASNVGMYGYPQGAKMDAGKGGGDQYGYRYYYDQGGSIHTHMINYKVDLDIAGTKNTMAYDEIKPNKILGHAWDPLLPASYNTKIERVKVTNERKSSFKINPQTPKQYYIMNEKALNRWGHPRGYRLHIEKLEHQILPNDHPLMPGIGWTKNQIVATRRKDDERVSQTLYEQASPATPVLNFEHMLDGEALQGQDIVAWLTIGVHHLPLSEDAPNTPMNGNYGGFTLRPHNYFDEDPTRDMLETMMLLRDISSGGGAFGGAATSQGDVTVLNYVGDRGHLDVACNPTFPALAFNGSYGIGA